MCVRHDLHVGHAAAERPSQRGKHREIHDPAVPVVAPDSSTAAIAAIAPGIIAPYSWPKFPRIPHPSESERAVKTWNSEERAGALGVAVMMIRDSSLGGGRLLGARLGTGGLRAGLVPEIQPVQGLLRLGVGRVGFDG